MFVVTEAMKAKLGATSEAEPKAPRKTKAGKVDGRTTRKWTKAQRRAIAKRLAAGKAAARAARESATA